MRGRILPLIVLFLALGVGNLFAANVSVDSFELMSDAELSEDGLFQVASRLHFGLSIEGGDKFAGLIRFDFLSTKVEDDLAALNASLSALTGADTDQATVGQVNGLIASLNSRLALPGLRLKTAAVAAKSIFGAPIEASFFVGNLDTFCSGDDFVNYFGAVPFATELRGPLRFPDGIKGNPAVAWNGLHAVDGSGFRIGLTQLQNSRIYAYIYQDSALGAGKWSADFRALFDRKGLKLEAFGGASFDSASDYGLYRGGLLFFASPGDIGEFYAQIGVPRWDPEESFDAKKLFFLFEPRINFPSGALMLSVFYHPEWYMQKRTQEEGYLDIGLNLRFGSLSTKGSQGGYEVYLSLRPDNATSPVTVDLSPYYDMIASGIAWSFKLGIRPWPFPEPWYGMFRPFIGVKTSF